MERKGNCSCGKALCCLFKKFIVPRIITRDEEKYYKLRNIQIIKENQRTILRVPLRCSALGEDLKCKVYSNRPIFCMKYPEKKEDLIEGCTFYFE